MTLTPQAAVAMFYEAEYRFFDGPPPPPPEVALTDVAGVAPTPPVTSVNGATGTTAARATTRATDNRTYPYSSGPVASTRRPHLAALDANPPHPLERWACSWTFRYRRALGDSRRVAFRRALTCALDHGGRK